MKDENIFVGDFGKRHYDAELGKARGKVGNVLCHPKDGCRVYSTTWYVKTSTTYVKTSATYVKITTTF